MLNLTDQERKRLLKLEREIKELADFKEKVEVGSWLIRCTAYTVGGVALFIVSLLTIFEKWPFK